MVYFVSMDGLVLAIVIFLLSTMISRIIVERSLKKLTNEQKGMLVTSFSKTRMVSIISLGIVIIGFLLIAYFKLWDTEITTYAYFGVLILFFMINSYLAHLRLSRLEIPKFYITANFYASIIRIVGIIIFVYLIMRSLTPIMHQQHAENMFI